MKLTILFNWHDSYYCVSADSFRPTLFFCEPPALPTELWFPFKKVFGPNGPQAPQSTAVLSLRQVQLHLQSFGSLTSSSDPRRPWTCQFVLASHGQPTRQGCKQTPNFSATKRNQSSGSTSAPRGSPMSSRITKTRWWDRVRSARTTLQRGVVLPRSVVPQLSPAKQKPQRVHQNPLVSCLRGLRTVD